MKKIFLLFTLSLLHLAISAQIIKLPTDLLQRIATVSTPSLCLPSSIIAWNTSSIASPSNSNIFLCPSFQNVGIGTSTPGQKLVVQQTDQQSWAVNFVSPYYNRGMYFGFSSNTPAIQGYSPAGPGAGYENLFLNPYGNKCVAIGTPSVPNSSSYTLVVEGKLGAREIIVTDQGWADYVFSENYNLRSISDLEKFINENKHLPNVPSQEEIQDKGGKDLGALQTKMMEKIEELTLYMIQQNKKIEELEKKNIALEEAFHTK